MRMRPLAGLTLAGFVLALGAAGSAPAAPAPKAAAHAPSGADTRFKALYEKEWTWREAEFPGSSGGDAPIADHLPRVDPASHITVH